MGYSNHFLVKAKTYVLSAEEGYLVLSFVKRSRGVSCAVHLARLFITRPVFDLNIFSFMFFLIFFLLLARRFSCILPVYLSCTFCLFLINCIYLPKKKRYEKEPMVLRSNDTCTHPKNRVVMDSRIILRTASFASWAPALINNHDIGLSLF
jgi:hypothetical protein